MAATAGTPDVVLDKIHADIVKILSEPNFVDKVIKAQSFEPVITTRSEFISFLRSEELRWGQLVRDSGAKVE